MKTDSPPLRRWLICSHLKMQLPYWPRDLHTLAHHEAAHAVYGHLLDAKVVAVERDRALFKPPALDASANAMPSNQELLEIVAAAVAGWNYAGIMAEFILHDIQLTGRVHLETQDWRQARSSLVRGFGEDRAERAMFYSQKLCTFVLQRHWDLVAAIAHEVEHQGRCSGEDVARICAGRVENWAAVTDRW